MSDKIKSHHLARKAILYIRQSSAYQVIHNLESQRLQYAMQDRLHHLGWREIDVVDEDLGRSAAGLVTRAGFERMVAEVCLGEVGRGSGSVALRPQQPRVATIGRSMSRRGYRTHRPRNGLQPAPQQRSVAVGAERQFERIRTGSLASAVGGSATREGPTRRAPGGRGRGVCQNGCAAFRERSRSARAGSRRVGVPQIRRTGDRASDPLVVPGAWAAPRADAAGRHQVETPFLRHAVPHAPEPDVRRRLRVDPEVITEFVDLLRTHNACDEAVLHELLRTPKMQDLLRAYRHRRLASEGRTRRLHSRRPNVAPVATADEPKPKEAVPLAYANYDRKRLYEQVWSEPTQRVATLYGVSDVAIAKACKHLKIPKPPRGYWARKAAGVPLPPRPPLPDS